MEKKTKINYMKYEKPMATVNLEAILLKFRFFSQFFYDYVY